MGWIVLVVIVLTVLGVALAAYGRHGNTRGGITEDPVPDGDHPDFGDGRAAFEQATDDRGTR